MFDRLYEAFNTGLPEGWYLDDGIETVRTTVHHPKWTTMLKSGVDAKIMVDLTKVDDDKHGLYCNPNTSTVECL